MKNLMLYITLFLVLSTATSGYLYKRERKERQRLELNQASLFTGLKHYKTKDSLNASRIQKLTLSKQELKEHEAALVAEVKNLGIKLKRVERIIQVGTETNVKFKTIRKDSLIYLPGKDSIIRMECME